MADEGQAAAEDGPADVVQVAMSGVVAFDNASGLLQGALVQLRAGQGGIEAAAEELDQLPGDFRLGAEGADDFVQAEAIRLVVGQVEVAEGDEGVDQEASSPDMMPLVTNS